MDARNAGLPAPSAPHGEGWLLGLLLGTLFLIRLIQIDQPIVENYVGRQVPTAMAVQSRAGIGVSPAPTRHGAFPELLPRRAAAL